MSSELPFNFNPPPSEFDPGDSQHLARVIRDPAGVPLHRHKIEVEQRFEEITTTRALSSDYDWVILGLAYCLIKIDTSLIEAYRDALGESIQIKSHLADHPLVLVRGSSSWDSNPWAGTIQGLPLEHMGPFIDYVATHVFRRHDTGHDWICNFKQIEIPDPFSPLDRHVTAWVALPRNTTLKRSLVLEPLLGVGNWPPVASMAKDRDHA